MTEKEFFHLSLLFRQFYKKTILPLFYEAWGRRERSISEKPRKGIGLELVGELDKLAERCYFEFFRENFPGDEIFSEESKDNLGSWPPKAKRFWAVDPRDGTHMGLAGVPMEGTMSVLVENGKVIFSIVVLHCREVLTGNGVYSAGKGRGAWEWDSRGKVRLSVSKEES